MKRMLADTAGHGVNANRVVMDMFVTLVLGRIEVERPVG
jgi:hypothetical protein